MRFRSDRLESEEMVVRTQRFHCLIENKPVSRGRGQVLLLLTVRGAAGSQSINVSASQMRGQGNIIVPHLCENQSHFKHEVRSEYDQEIERRVLRYDFEQTGYIRLVHVRPHRKVNDECEGRKVCETISVVSFCRTKGKGDSTPNNRDMAVNASSMVRFRTKKHTTKASIGIGGMTSAGAQVSRNREHHLVRAHLLSLPY